MAVARNDPKLDSHSPEIVHQSAVPRPYKDVSTNNLVTTLEVQYDRGTGLDPEIVFEIAGRLMDAEGISIPTRDVDEIHFS